MSKTQKKGVFDSIHDSVEDDVAGFKKFVPGETKFEISESDTLEEDERKLSYDLTHPGEYKFTAESKGKGKFKIQVEAKNSHETITISQGTLQGKNGKNSSFEVEFVVKRHQIPLTFNVNLTCASGYFKAFSKASYSFKLTKTDEKAPDNNDPRGMNQVTEDQLKTLLKKEKETSKKQQVKIKVKIVLPTENEIKYDYIDPRDSPELTLERFRKDYGDKVMKYQDNETDFVSLNSKEDFVGFLENVEKDKIPKIYLFETQSSTSFKKNMGSVGINTSPSDSPNPTSKKKPLNINSTIQWKKGQKLGKGAFGVVYMGLNEDTGKLMAVKEVDLNGTSFSEDKLKALQSEIDLLSKLEHENIVKYLGMQRTDDHLYIMLTYVPGGSIESVLKTFLKLKEPVVKRYTRQILNGLDYLHSKNILHRDIKSGNILLDEHGTVYLSDFGSAKKFTKELQKKEKILEGTPNYMPPEVIEYSKYTKASDIWALGCTVLEMLTGNPPFHEVLHEFNTPLEFFYWRREQKPKLVIPDSLSENAKSFLQACLQDYSENRKKASELLNHVFITGKEEEDDFQSEEEEEEEAQDLPSSVPEYVDDGFDFDDIPPPDPLPDEVEHKLVKKTSLKNDIATFLKKNAQNSTSFFK